MNTIIQRDTKDKLVEKYRASKLVYKMRSTKNKLGGSYRVILGEKYTFQEEKILQLKESLKLY